MGNTNDTHMGIDRVPIATQKYHYGGRDNKWNPNNP